MKCRALLPFTIMLCASGIASPVAAESACAGAVDVAVLARELGRMRDSDPQGAIDQATRALQELRATGDGCAVAKARLETTIAINLSAMARAREAVALLASAIRVFEEHGVPDGLALAHRAAGIAQREMGRYDRSLEHNLAALAASEAMGDAIGVAGAAGNIGNLYVRLGRLSLASAYHQRALAGFEGAGHPLGIAGTLSNLGNLTLALSARAASEGDPDAAAGHAREALDYNERARDRFLEIGNLAGVATSTQNLGKAHFLLGGHQLALDHYRDSLELWTQVGDQPEIADAHLRPVDALIALGRYREAASAIERAAALAPAPSLDRDERIASARSALAEARRDFAAALEWQREVTRLQAAISEAQHETRAAELQLAFDADEQARRIELLSTNAEIAGLQLQRQRLLLQVGWVIGALFGCLLLVLSSRYRAGVAAAIELERAARSDPLTGLSNRRDMRERIERELVRATRSSRPFSLIMADVDNFKPVNDSFGHDVGDAVLRGVSERMRAHLRAHDTLARWGGEEFLVLLPETDLEGAVTVANRLREALAAEQLRAVGRELAVTVTMGVSAYRPPMSVERCIKAADEALYTGKGEGKNRVVPSASCDAGTVDPLPVSC